MHTEHSQELQVLSMLRLSLEHKASQTCIDAVRKLITERALMALERMVQGLERSLPVDEALALGLSCMRDISKLNFFKLSSNGI